MIKNLLSNSGSVDELLAIVNDFKMSDTFRNINIAEKYYNGYHDILLRKRTVIGENGIPKEVMNIPNNRIVDNLYAKLVDQKTNYLLSMPISFDCENKDYEMRITQYFNKKNHKLLKNVCEDSLKFGTGYVFINYNNSGELVLKKLSPLEVIPIFSDDEEEDLIGIIRFIKDGEKDIIEVYDKDYIYYYEVKGGNTHMYNKKPYISINGKGYSFGKLPIIHFKYNQQRIPLITRVKSLQDGINKVISDFQNNMEEDCRNTVLVLQNFDGTNLAEFRKNLSEYGVVKVKTVDGQAGDVKTLNVSVNSENYKTIIDLMKKAMIENGRGFDLKNENTFSTMNQMNIKSLYTDIDLDARGMETEFRTSISEIIWFLNIDLYNKYGLDFFEEKLDIIFNKDTIVNESDVIEDCVNSIGILDMEIIKKNHPWS